MLLLWILLIKWWTVGFIFVKLWSLYSSAVWGCFTYAQLNPTKVQWETLNPFLFLYTYISLRIFLNSYTLLKRVLAQSGESAHVGAAGGFYIGTIVRAAGIFGIIWILGVPWIVLTILIKVLKNIRRCTPLWTLYEEAVFLERRAHRIRICFYESFFTFNPGLSLEIIVQTFKTLNIKLQSQLLRTLTQPPTELIKLPVQRSLAITASSRSWSVVHPCLENYLLPAANTLRFFNFNKHITILGGTRPVASYPPYTFFTPPTTNGGGGQLETMEQRTQFGQVNYPPPPYPVPSLQPIYHIAPLLRYEPAYNGGRDAGRTGGTYFWWSAETDPLFSVGGSDSARIGVDIVGAVGRPVNILRTGTSNSVGIIISGCFAPWNLRLSSPTCTASTDRGSGYNFTGIA